MPVAKIPFLIPWSSGVHSGSSSTSSPVDTGGYDVMVGGYGFRLATDQSFPYSRTTEPVTAQRFDSGNEPNEHSLSPLPWIKSQSSFHGGAGQLNLEAPLSTFQYQEAHIEHLRFDASLGMDVWTPGQIQRLPSVSLYNFGVQPTIMTMANVSGIDYAIVGGGPGVGLWQVAWNSGPDSAPTLTQINDGDYGTGGRGNATMIAACNDGTSYYVMVKLGTPNSFSVQCGVLKGTIGSTAAPTFWAWPSTATTWTGAIAFVKNRLMLACVSTVAAASGVYELSTTTQPGNLGTQTPKYVHPNTSFNFRAISESPSAILIAGDVNGFNSNIMRFTLDSAGGTPTLTGGAVIATMPTGEQILDMQQIAGSALGIATSQGMRFAEFDPVSGTMKVGPLSVTTSQPVNAIAARSRFLYGSYTNQQQDGTTGLVRMDISQPVDSAGRLAWAADLRPPSTAPTGQGVVSAVDVLPQGNRMVFLTPEGIHVEGNGPSSSSDAAWLRTSRMRFSTAEKKLFKLGRINGSLDVSTIQVTGIAPFASDVNLGTFGFLSNGDPGEFSLPSGLNEWIQLKFTLSGSSCKLYSYYAKAYPAPSRQHIIEFTALCFSNEVDRFGIDVTDPKRPRDRYQAVAALEKAGNQVQFVEFTNTGSITANVIIDQLTYRSFSRPNIEDDFGGYITFRLRTVDTS